MRSADEGAWWGSDSEVGHPLPTAVLAELESAFGVDLGSIRVLEEPVACALLGAEAFAFGERIVFSPGAFEPETMRGRALLAHELVHVLQQREGRAAPHRPGQLVVDTPPLEAEARHVARQVALGRRVPRGWRARRPSRFGRRPVIQRIKESFMGIGGLKLLQILDQEVDDVVSKHASKIRPHKFEEAYVMSSGSDWLAAAGHLTISKSKWSARNTWVPCKLQVGPSSDQTVLNVTGDQNRAFSERLDFPGTGKKRDLNYKQISQQIRGLGIDEGVQAHGILLRMRGIKHFATTGTNSSPFLNAMVALLFGLEASRNKATLATTLMLLDLVREGKMYGRKGNKPFTLSGAFDSSHGYQWDDGESGSGHLYGGKHPMAVHGTGGGNIRRRYEMTSNPDDSTLNQELKFRNQQHAVPRREISLLVHWLEAMTPPSPRITINEGTVRTWIKWRLGEGYVTKSGPLISLRGNPRTDTGVHTTLHWDGKTIYFTFDRSKDTVVGRYYHADSNCKLLPVGPNYAQAFSTDIDGIVSHFRLLPCEYCWKRVQVT